MALPVGHALLGMTVAAAFSSAAELRMKWVSICLWAVPGIRIRGQLGTLFEPDAIRVASLELLFGAGLLCAVLWDKIRRSIGKEFSIGG